MDVVESALMAQIIRGMTRNDPEREDELSACYETRDRRSRNMSCPRSSCSRHEPCSDAHRLADRHVREIAALRGNAALNLPVECAARLPSTGAAGRVKLALQLYEIASSTASAVVIQLVFTCGAVLTGLFGMTVLITLLRTGNLAHQELSRVARVGLGPTSDVLSRGAPPSASSDSAASPKAKSAIEGWFVLRPPPGQVGASSTTSPIKVPRIVPGQ